MQSIRRWIIFLIAVLSTALFALPAWAEADDWDERVSQSGKNWEDSSSKDATEALKDRLADIIETSASELEDEASEEQLNKAFMDMLADALSAEASARTDFLEESQLDGTKCRFLGNLLCNTYEELCIECVRYCDHYAPDKQAKQDSVDWRSRRRTSVETALRELVSGNNLDSSLKRLDEYDAYTPKTIPMHSPKDSLRSLYVTKHADYVAKKHSDTYVRPPDGAPYDVYVHGYYRKDGTYVRPHYRRHPKKH